MNHIDTEPIRMATKRHRNAIRFGNDLLSAYTRTHLCAGTHDFLRLFAANLSEVHA